MYKELLQINMKNSKTFIEKLVKNEDNPHMNKHSISLTIKEMKN